MTLITDEVINKTTNDYNLFLLLKKNMIKGEIKLSNLSSKNRSVLHQLCYNYGLEHYSTGNYKNRVLIIKDPTHTYFNTSNPFPFQILKNTDTSTNDEYKFISQPEEKEIEEKDIEEEENEEEKEEKEEKEEEEEEEEEEEDEEVDTDTYSSDESESSEYTQTYQVVQNINISNQLNTLRMFSYINLIMNVIIICNL